MKKYIVLIATLSLMIVGCDNEKSQKHIDVKQKIQTNTTPTITIKKGEKAKDDDKFISYNMDGERKIEFELNNENSQTTKSIVGYARIRNPYENINLALIKKRLSKDFILRCSACHNDYANGIIGPSLLDKTDSQIKDMITKYKFKEKANPLMVQLVNQMSEAQINEIANEIYEFNKQFKEQK